MTYTAKFEALKAHNKAQRAYTRAIARRGLPALLAPYSVRVPVVPSQRRRAVTEERISA